MSRRDRLIVPGLPHHCTHRGNRRSQTFFENADYEMYLRLLRKYCQRFELRLWAYTLMPNHVHLVAVPPNEQSLSEMIQCVDGTYAVLFNGLYDKSGHLWEGRFFSSVMDETYLLNAIRYVERNPVRAGLVLRAEDYPWSSAAAHCGLRPDPLLSNDVPFANLIEDWSAWLAIPNPPDVNQTLRDRTQTGYPCGSDRFILNLELQLARRIRPQKTGRKPKTAAAHNSTERLKFSN
jgi:putative transposase